MENVVLLLGIGGFLTVINVATAFLRRRDESKLERRVDVLEGCVSSNSGSVSRIDEELDLIWENFFSDELDQDTAIPNKKTNLSDKLNSEIDTSNQTYSPTFNSLSERYGCGPLSIS